MKTLYLALIFSWMAGTAHAATVTLSWDAPPAGTVITGYNLYRSPTTCALAPNPLPKTAKVGTITSATAVTMADTITVSSPYCYALSAYNLSAESPQSVTVTP
jgi:hypothetical protein